MYILTWTAILFAKPHAHVCVRTEPSYAKTRQRGFTHYHNKRINAQPYSLWYNQTRSAPAWNCSPRTLQRLRLGSINYESHRRAYRDACAAHPSLTHYLPIACRTARRAGCRGCGPVAFRTVRVLIVIKMSIRLIILDFVERPWRNLQIWAYGSIFKFVDFARGVLQNLILWAVYAFRYRLLCVP